MKKRFLFTLLVVAFLILAMIFFMPSILRDASFLSSEQRETIESAFGISESGPPTSEVNIEWNSHIREERAITDYNKGHTSRDYMPVKGGNSDVSE